MNEHDIRSHVMTLAKLVGKAAQDGHGAIDNDAAAAINAATPLLAQAFVDLNRIAAALEKIANR